MIDFKALKRGSENYINNPKFAEAVAFMSAEAAYVRKIQKNLKDKFFDLHKMGVQPYVAGIAGELPFLDNSFDLVYSSCLHGTILVDNLDLLTRALEEGLRVLKLGGRFQIFPWNPEEWNGSITLNRLKKKRYHLED